MRRHTIQVQPEGGIWGFTPTHQIAPPPFLWASRVRTKPVRLGGLHHGVVSVKQFNLGYRLLHPFGMR